MSGAVILIAVAGLTMNVAQTQQAGIKRTDLQRHDLSTPGREVVQEQADYAADRITDAHTVFWRLECGP